MGPSFDRAKRTPVAAVESAGINERADRTQRRLGDVLLAIRLAFDYRPTRGAVFAFWGAHA
jgi:hypothetical protein